jgi:NAD(P)-dependent dehydrogenase (short-subunit alcohol dehydrogenase family)
MVSKRNSKEVDGPIGWKPPDLRGKVAVVAGASRGAARGIALALGETSATVYVAARTTRNAPKPYDGAPGTIEDTAEEITRRGGQGIPVRTDCSNETQVAALFERVEKEQGRLDILANGCWGSSEQTTAQFFGKEKRPFWELEKPLGWEESIQWGAYPCLLTTHYAARLMATQRKGLMVHVTEPVGDDPNTSSLFWLFTTMGHRGINRMVAAMKSPLGKRNIAIIALCPGFMRTERVQKHMENVDEAGRRKWGYHNSETTEYSGRAVASLASDSKVLMKSGKLLYVGDLAGEYGFKDADGRDVGNFYKKTKIHTP